MGVRKNFYYSSILTSAGYIFPLITYPYVSRVLGVSNIGICNFVHSVIDYFVLFSMMGIRTIGIREIAKCQGSKELLSRTFTNLIILNLFFLIISSIVLFIIIQIIPQLNEHKDLMYIGIGKLFATFLLIEWLYKGVEDFKYITRRSIIVRCLYVVSIFLLVREESDYPIYFALLVVTELVNAFINCLYARKYIVLDFRNLHPFKYLKSCMIIGCYGFLTTMYTTFNVAYLGFVTNTTEVGYYTTATKLHHIILALFTAFTGVMLPRMSNLVARGNLMEFSRKINQSFVILIFFSFPLIVIGMCFATDIVRIISGAGYEPAATPLAIVMPLVFIIGLEQILVQQVLMPLRKDKAILVNAVVGAAVGIFANILIVKDFGGTGSAIVWFLSEISVMVSALVFASKDIVLSELKRRILWNILYMLPPLVFCLLVQGFFGSGTLVFLVSSILVFVYYVIVYLSINDVVFKSLLPAKLNKWKRYQ